MNGMIRLPYRMNIAMVNDAAVGPWFGGWLGLCGY